jgi:hypothetical protein
MTRFATCFVLMMAEMIAGACAQAKLDAHRAEPRIALSVFQSGQVIVFNAETGRVLRAIPSQDGGGISAIAISPKDGTLVIVDQSLQSRLRLFDAKTFALTKEAHFENRVLNFSDHRLLQLSADGNWLFLYTYNYTDGKSGLRIYDVRRLDFVSSGIRDLACAAPLFATASGGSVFALCPGKIQDISPQSGEFASRASVAMPLTEVITAAATADGSHLYAVGASQSGGGRQLIDWNRNSGELTQRDLATLLPVPPSEASGSGFTSIAISSDARSLALVRGTELWVVDRLTSKVTSHHKLPSRAIGTDFVPDGRNVLSLHGEQGSEFTVVSTPAGAGESRSITLTTERHGASPVAFAVGPGS